MSSKAAQELPREVVKTLSGEPESPRKPQRVIRAQPKSDKAHGSCCGLFRSKAKEKPFEQTLVVLRHSERWDHKDPEGFKASEEGQKYPFDGPITPNGVQLAAKVAKELQKVHSEVSFAGIACSPFLRCLETAAEVAKILQIPVMLDQELAEVWEKAMPSTHLPHRDPEELVKVCDSLGLTIANPIENGAYRLFGKIPEKHPEDLEAGHKRYLVRIENYIRLSTRTRRNFIIVGHASAVAAALNMFERGFADIEKTEYCARIIARRNVIASTDEQDEQGVYAAHWNVESKDVVVQVDKDAADYMKKTMETMHMDFVEETNTMVAKRKERRTSTDKIFDDTVKALANIEEEPDDSANTSKRANQV